MKRSRTSILAYHPERRLTGGTWEEVVQEKRTLVKDGKTDFLQRDQTSAGGWWRMRKLISEGDQISKVG